MKKMKEEFFLNKVSQIVAPDKMMTYLTHEAYHLSLSLANELLLFHQNEEAGIVCDIASWKQLGRTIEPSARKWNIVLPFLIEQEEKATIDYQVINVVEEKDTQGKEIPQVFSIDDLPDHLSGSFEIIIESVPANKLLNRRNPYDIDYEEGIFRLSATLDGNKYYGTLLNAFIDYMERDNLHPDAALMTLAMRYILCRRYHLPSNNMKGILFQSLTQKRPVEILAFLEKLHKESWRVCQLLEGTMLTFEESALLSQIILKEARQSPIEYQKLMEILDLLLFGNNRDIQLFSLEELTEKLEQITEEDFQQMQEKIKINGAFPLYPPVVIRSK